MADLEIKPYSESLAQAVVDAPDVPDFSGKQTFNVDAPPTIKALEDRNRRDWHTRGQAVQKYISSSYYEPKIEGESLVRSHFLNMPMLNADKNMTTKQLIKLGFKRDMSLEEAEEKVRGQYAVFGDEYKAKIIEHINKTPEQKTEEATVALEQRRREQISAMQVAGPMGMIPMRPPEQPIDADDIMEEKQRQLEEAWNQSPRAIIEYATSYLTPREISIASLIATGGDEAEELAEGYIKEIRQMEPETYSQFASLVQALGPELDRNFHERFWGWRGEAFGPLVQRTEDFGHWLKGQGLDTATYYDTQSEWTMRLEKEFTEEEQARLWHSSGVPNREFAERYNQTIQSASGVTLTGALMELSMRTPIEREHLQKEVESRKNMLIMYGQNMYKAELEKRKRDHLIGQIGQMAMPKYSDLGKFQEGALNVAGVTVDMLGLAGLGMIGSFAGGPLVGGGLVYAFSYGSHQETMENELIDAGMNGYDARVLSSVSSAVWAGVEKMQIGRLSKSANAWKAFYTGVKNDPSIFMKYFGDFAKRQIKIGAKETLEEYIQAGIDYATRETARLHFEADGLEWDENVESLITEIVEATKVMPFVTLIGGGSINASRNLVMGQPLAPVELRRALEDIKAPVDVLNAKVKRRRQLQLLEDQGTLRIDEVKNVPNKVAKIVDQAETTEEATEALESLGWTPAEIPDLILKAKAKNELISTTKEVMKAQLNHLDRQKQSELAENDTLIREDVDVAVALEELHEQLGTDLDLDIVETQEELLEKYPEARRDDRALIEAFITGDGKVVMVRENLRDARHAVETWAHEVIGHHGLDRIDEGRRDEIIEDMAEMVGLDNMRLELGPAYADLTDAKIVDEYLARYIGQAYASGKLDSTPEQATFWQKIKDWMAKILGIGDVEKMNDRQVMALASEIFNNLRDVSGLQPIEFEEGVIEEEPEVEPEAEPEAVAQPDEQLEMPLEAEAPMGQQEFRFSLRVTPEQTVEAQIVANDAGIMIDPDTRSMAPSWSEPRYSARTWDEETKAKVMETAKELGIPEDQVNRWLEDIDNIMARVLLNPALDFDPTGADLYTVLKGNSDPHYTKSVDFSTLCRKRYVIASTLEEIQVRLGRALEKEEWVQVREMLNERGLEVSCGACYVDAKRMEQGKFINQFLEANPQLDPRQVLTQEGQDELLRDNPQLFAEFKKKAGSNNSKASESRSEYNGEILKFFKEGRDTKLNPQSKVMEWTTKVNEEKGKQNVEAFNERSGLRWQSWSDFELVHLMDAMQVILDMNLVGLQGHAYTKVPEFVEAIGHTGLMLNMSLLAKGNGLDADGNLVFDPKEGMPFEKAMELRDKFPQTAGTIAVGVSNDHIDALLNDPRIDYVIPYHASGLSKDIAKVFGMDEWVDFTKTQTPTIADVNLFHKKIGKDYPKLKEVWKERPRVTEKSGKKQIAKYNKWLSKYKKEAKSLGADAPDINEWWVDGRTGKENGDTYLKWAEENGIAPLFREHRYADGRVLKDFTKDPNYWKLLIDRKSFDNDGNPIIQKPVKPEYDNDALQSLLNDYTEAPTKADMETVDAFLEGKDVKPEKPRFSVAQQRTPSREVAVIASRRMVDGKTVSMSQVQDMLERTGGKPELAEEVIGHARTIYKNIRSRQEEFQNDAQINQAIRDTEIRQHYYRLSEETYAEGRKDGRWEQRAQDIVQQRMQRTATKTNEATPALAPDDMEDIDIANLIEQMDIEEKAFLVGLTGDRTRTEKDEEEAEDLEDIPPPEYDSEVVPAYLERVRNKILESMPEAKTIKDPKATVRYRKSMMLILNKVVGELTYGRTRTSLEKRIMQMKSLKDADRITVASLNIIETAYHQRVRENVKSMKETWFKITRVPDGQGNTTQRWDKKALNEKYATFLRFARQASQHSVEDAEEFLEELDNEINEMRKLENTPKAKRTDTNSLMEELLAKRMAWEKYGALFKRRTEDDEATGKKAGTYYKSLAEMKDAVDWAENSMRQELAKQEERIKERKQRHMRNREILIKATMRGTKLTRGKPRDTTRGTSPMMFEDRLHDMIRGAKGQTRKDAIKVIEELMLQISDANQNMRVETVSEMNKLRDAVQMIYGLKNQREIEQKMYELAKPDEKYNRFSKQNNVLSTQQMLQLIAWVEQEQYTYDAFKMGYRIEEMRNAVSDQDYELLEWMREYYRDTRGALSEVSMRITGLPVKSPDPNYMPVKLWVGKGLERLIVPQIVPKSLSTRKISGREHDESVGIFDMYSDRVHSNSVFKYFAEVALDMRGIFLAEDLQREVRNTFGDNYFNKLRDHATDIMTQKPLGGDTSTAVRWLMGFGVTKLWASIGPALAQMSSAPAFLYNPNAGKVLNYIRKNPLSVERKSAIAKMWNSPQARARLGQGNSYAIAEAFASAKHGQNPVMRALKRAGQIGLKPNQMMDLVTISLVGSAVYQKNLDLAQDMFKTDAEREDWAMRKTWQEVEQSQQSAFISQQATWQRLGGAGKLLGIFTSTVQQYLSREMRDVRAWKANNTPETRRNLMKTLVINHIIMPTLYLTLKQVWKWILGDEPEEDEWKDWLTYAVVGPFSSWFVAGSIIEPMVNTFFSGNKGFRGDSFVPASSIITDAKSLSMGVHELIINGDWDEAMDEFKNVLKSNVPAYRDLKKMMKERFDIEI